MRQLARGLISEHGNLLEARCISKKRIELIFADGHEERVGDYTGHIDITLMKYGYPGTGSRCFHAFLIEAGFNVTYEQVTQIEDGTIVRPGMLVKADELEVQAAPLVEAEKPRVAKLTHPLSYTVKCPQCGHMNPDTVGNCEICEINLAWALEHLQEPCPACGAMNPARSERCSNCNLNLELAKEQKEKEQRAVKQQEAQIIQPEEPTIRQAQPEVEAKDIKEEARKSANSALISAIVGIFICAIILGPSAISQARKAKKVLGPGEPGYGKAQAAEIIGWLSIVLWVIALIIQFSDM
jgi:hypothetical protein